MDKLLAIWACILYQPKRLGVQLTMPRSRFTDRLTLSLGKSADRLRTEHVMAKLLKTKCLPVRPYKPRQQLVY